MSRTYLVCDIAGVIVPLAVRHGGSIGEILIETSMVPWLTAGDD